MEREKDEEMGFRRWSLEREKRKKGLKKGTATAVSQRGTIRNTHEKEKYGKGESKGRSGHWKGDLGGGRWKWRDKGGEEREVVSWSSGKGDSGEPRKASPCEIGAVWWPCHGPPLPPSPEIK